MKLSPMLVRAWLNRRGSLGVAHVFVDFKGADLAKGHGNTIILNIADCSRSIALEFPVKTTKWESAANSLFKVRKLMEVLKGIEDRLLQAIEYEEDNPPTYEEDV